MTTPANPAAQDLATFRNMLRAAGCDPDATIEYLKSRHAVTAAATRGGVVIRTPEPIVP